MVNPRPADDTEPVICLDRSRIPRLIELAGSGPESQPGIIRVSDGLWKLDLPARAVVLGHASDYHGDPDGPILTDGVMHPPGSALPAQVCEGCDPEVIIAPSPEFTFLIASHQRGCARYAGLARRWAS